MFILKIRILALMVVLSLFVPETTTENTSHSGFTIGEVILKYQIPVPSKVYRGERGADEIGLHNTDPNQEDCNCGPNGNCSFVGGKKYCTCENNYAVKDDDLSKPGICHPCNCGSDLESSGCLFTGFFVKHCRCKKGYAQRSNQCIKCECGSHGKCSFDGWNKVCACEQGFAETGGVCLECDCGSNGNCSYANGKKVCACEKNFAVKEDDVYHAGKCHACNCGSELESNGCLFQGFFVKNCRCKKGYAQRSNQCIKCDCGPHGNCSFDDWKKVCGCDKGFIEKNGICKECDCGDGGRCELNDRDEKVCHCIQGRKLHNGYCEECDCGNGGECELDISGQKLCHCKPGYGLKNGLCLECNCGPGEHECEFDTLGVRLCKCKLGYATKLDGFCHACNCQLQNMGCTFNHNDGEKTCMCPEGYEEKQNFCVDLNECLMEEACPFSTECKNTMGSYRCICKSGYRPHEDGRDIKIYGCIDVNECWEWNPCPYTDTTVCMNLPGSYQCICKEGYDIHPSGMSPQSSGCIAEQWDWQIAAISVGVVFLIIIVGLVIATILRSRNRFRR